MPEFDDISLEPHFRHQLDYPISLIERYTVLLKDGETTLTIYPIHSVEELPPGLLAFLCDEFNMEVDRGDTFPFFDTLHIESFQNYWFGSFAAVMVLGDVPTLDRSKQWEKECLGTFFIKPNYPGRSAHICTAQFLVNAGIRGKGIGRTLAECFLEWAPRLGYTYSVFNLVFDSNVLAKKIWDSLGFKVIGTVKSAGILKGHDQAVDALIYGRELILNADPTGGSFRFDRIRYYLETGKYPENLDRHEKSRLRSSASHYRLIEGKLMLKGREVVSNPSRQLEIATMYHHHNGHTGINKCTSVILEKYHWSRIKDTVAIVIRDCDECRGQRGQMTKRPLSSLKNSKPHTTTKQEDHDTKSNFNLLPHMHPLASLNQEPLNHQESLNHHNHHDHHNHHPLDHLLHGDFDDDDPSGIMAAVEAAQRSHNTNQHPQNSKPDSKQKQPHEFNYDSSLSGQESNYHYTNNDDLDTDVISLALIQANENSNTSDD